MDFALISIISTLLGTLMGAWIGARLNYQFQQRLLDQQLAFLKRQAEEDAQLRQQISKEWKAVFGEFRDTMNTRAYQALRKLAVIVGPEDPAKE